MRKKKGFVRTLIFLSCALLAACAAQPVKAPPPFDAQPVQGQWIPKADHLYFILDASSSMEDSYDGHVKFDIAKATVNNFNQTMPDVDVQAALRGFGFSRSLSEKVTLLFYGPQDYTRTGLVGAESGSKATQVANWTDAIPVRRQAGSIRSAWMQAERSKIGLVSRTIGAARGRAARGRPGRR